MDDSRHPVARLRSGEAEFLLYAGQPLRIGRAEENEIVINDPKVSRMHAELEWNGSGFNLRDLGSYNGTFVNGQRLSDSSRLLSDGDEVTVCKQQFFYELLSIVPLILPEDSAAQVTSADPPTGAYLLVAAGPDKGQCYPLWGEVITIGRASREATWEIRLTDRAVSRPHARLERMPSGLTLLDLESANGTQINGAPVTAPVPVSEGDVIMLGETRLVYHSGEGTAPASDAS